MNDIGLLLTEPISQEILDYHVPNPYPTNILKEECKSKDMITAKFSKTIENLTNKNPEVISRDVQTNSNPPTKEPPL